MAIVTVEAFRAADELKLNVKHMLFIRWLIRQGKLSEK